MISDWQRKNSDQTHSGIMYDIFVNYHINGIEEILQHDKDGKIFTNLKKNTPIHQLTD